MIGLLIAVFATGAAAQITGELVNPNVMLLVDSSGSMDWLAHSVSINPWKDSEEACLAQDSNRRTSWQKLLDVMLGSIPGAEYRCMVEDPEIRPALRQNTLASDPRENSSEYREALHRHFRAVPCDPADWNDDYRQCIGNSLDPTAGATHGRLWCLDADWDATNGICYNLHPLARSRRPNGIIERYSQVVRFGLMTYDNMPAPAAPGTASLPNPHDGLWDFGPSRMWRCKEWYYDDPGAYPSCTWNAGIRSDNARAVGRMVPISPDFAASSQNVRHVLETAEPLNCSPMGALLDDVGHYFHSHPDVRAADDGGNDRYYWCRPKLVIFISDGQPTTAFEFPQDYCDEGGIAPLPPAQQVAAAPDEVYHCPWNSSEREVEELFDLIDPSEADPILLVVIGFNVPDVNCATHPDECVQTTMLGDLTTPREFLDNLAFKGWPSMANVTPPPWRPPYPSGFAVGDDPEDNCPSAVCGSGGALFVETPEQLSAVLDMVLGSLTTTTVTRTEVATTDQTSGALGFASFADKEVAQYEFNTGYETSAGLPWKGFLYRQGFECASEAGPGGAVSAPDPMHEWLDSQANRRIYTTPAGKLPGPGDYPSSIKDTPGGLTDVLALIEDTGEFSDCDFGGPTTTDADSTVLCSTSNAIQAEVAKHLYGQSGSQRRFHRLADIFNSTPSVLGPPMERLLVESYSSFKAENLPGEADRRIVERVPHLFVGTNDGVLHAFNVWATGSGDSVESWGYVPNTLLPTIREQFPIEWTLQTDLGGNYTSYTVSTTGQYQHIYGVDGAPVTADVRLYRRPGMNPENESKLWRSVVLGSLGRGGRGYYCLDVTNPAREPGFRWEISPDSAANNGGGPPDDPDNGDPDNPLTFDGMGIPVSRPALAYAYYETAIPGEGSTAAETEVAVAILPGGYWNDEFNGPEKSSGVYIVRVADGALVRYLDPSRLDDICPDPETPSAPAHEPLVAQLVGEPAVAQSARSALIAKEAYLGDDRGRLWRIDLSGTDPEEDWCLEMFFDTMITSHFPYQDCIPENCTATPAEYAADSCYAVDCCTGIDGYCPNATYPFPRIPIVNAPTVAQDRERNNIILFGTGQIDGIESLDHHRIFSLEDRIAYDVSGERTYHLKPTINWWLGEPIPTGALAADAGLDAKQQEQAMVDTHVWFAESGSLEFDFFNLGEKLIGRPVVFAEAAYFTTFIPTSPDSLNACESGGSRIWALHYALREGDNGAWEDSIGENDFGKFTSEGAETGDGGTGGSGFAPFVEYVGEIISGARVIRRPSCTGEATFQVVAQRVNSTPGQNQPPPAGQPRVQSVSIPITTGSIGFTTVFIDSWSLVFN